MSFGNDAVIAHASAVNRGLTAQLACLVSQNDCVTNESERIVTSDLFPRMPGESLSTEKLANSVGICYVTAVCFSDLRGCLIIFIAKRRQRRRRFELF